MKQRPIFWRITNYHFWGGLGLYFLMSMTQIGLPERFEHTRQVLTLVQLVLMFILIFLTLTNLVRNWE